ncbi:MAG: ACP S-malonyltransferase, partial [Gemmatimonadaceae bacterium]
VDDFPAALEVLAAADEALCVHLANLCFDGPESELTATRNAQPALLTHGAAVWAVLGAQAAPRVRAAAGHSLGEFTAYHAAGALPFVDAVRLVRRRGELMYQSGVQCPGSMAAVLGLDGDTVSRVCGAASASGPGTVVPANFNTPEQIVISGHDAAVERAMELAREAGAKRVLKLNVSGAFHSPLMEVAAAGLHEALRSATWTSPAFPVYANVNTEPIREAARAEQVLLQQLTAAVRWTDEVSAMARDYPDATFVEMGPGSVLANLVRRIIPGARTVPCGTAAEVERFLAQLS